MIGRTFCKIKPQFKYYQPLEADVAREVFKAAKTIMNHKNENIFAYSSQGLLSCAKGEKHSVRWAYLPTKFNLCITQEPIQGFHNSPSFRHTSCCV